MANSYDIGDRVRVSLAFSDDASKPADPTTVRGRFRDPSGVVTTYIYPTNVTKDSVGNYHFDIDPDADGEWRYRGEGEGAVRAAAEGRFSVRDSAFPPAA